MKNTRGVVIEWTAKEVLIVSDTDGGHVSSRPTIRDVAALAGVAVGTVSNVVNSPELVSLTKRQRVQEAIANLGWSPHSDAQRLASKGHGLTTPAPEAESGAAVTFQAEIDLPIDAGSQVETRICTATLRWRTRCRPSTDGRKDHRPTGAGQLQTAAALWQHHLDLSVADCSDDLSRLDARAHQAGRNIAGTKINNACASHLPPARARRPAPVGRSAVSLLVRPCR
jgi:Bacterial regulatory proteins, lacI family